MEITHDVLNVWGGGQLLAFSGIDGQTDFYHGLTARTSFDGLGVDVKLPGKCQLIFAPGFRSFCRSRLQRDFCRSRLQRDTGQLPPRLTLAGDFWAIETADGLVRGAFLDAYHLLIEGPCTVTRRGPEIAVRQQGGRTLVGSAVRFDPSKVDADLDAAIADRRRWLESIALPPGISDRARRTLVKALSQIKTTVYAPEGRIRRRFTTPDRWPHRGMWLWDSAFHAIGIRHLDVELAREILEAVFDGQREDGMVPMRTDPGASHAVSLSTFTQPPVLALATMLVEQAGPDRAWLERMLPRLAAYVQWDLDNRDSDGAGLAEWAIEEHENCRSGESGWDNSPRFDAATQLDATDLNSFLALECEILARLARSLKLVDSQPAEAQRWDEAHQRLCRLINERLWNEELGFYVDYDVERNMPSPVLAASGLLPLICRAPSLEQARQLAQAIRDPAMFGTPLPVPTVAARDTEHYAKDMWRGPVWVNVNWLIAYGLERYGMADIAQEIRGQTRAEIERRYLQFGSLFEFYDDRQEIDPPQLLRKGKCAPQESPFHQVFFDYGWTATLYVDMVFSSSGSS